MNNRDDNIHPILKKEGVYTAEETRDLVFLTSSSAIQAITMLVGETDRKVTKQKDDINEIKSSIAEIKEAMKEQNIAFSSFVFRCNPVIEAFEQQKIFKTLIIGKGETLAKFFVGVGAIITGLILLAQYVLKPLIVALLNK